MDSQVFFLLRTGFFLTSFTPRVTNGLNGFSDTPRVVALKTELSLIRCVWNSFLNGLFLRRNDR